MTHTSTAVAASLMARQTSQRPAAAPDAAARQPALTSFSTALGDAQQRAADTSRHRLDPASATPLLSGTRTAFQMPADLVQELARRTQEEQIREEINLRHAEANRYQTVGQVLVNGQLAAEVDEAGGYGLVQSLRGLSDGTLSPSDRLAEIARTLAGRGQVEIRRDHFVPGLGGWAGPAAPESALPAFTARSHDQIFAAALQAMEQQRA